MATVIVACVDEGGQLEAGVFLLDLLCLGVKDAFVTAMPATDWPRQLDRLIEPKVRQPLHPACARKLVEGAVAYAESLGFDPYRDYKKARRVFGSVSARDCPESFTFGHEGKPLYIAGPDDDQARIDRIQRTLTAKLGPEGFTYVMPADLEGEGEEPDEADDSRESEEPAGDTLRTLFAKWNRAGDFHVVSGMVTAACVCPGDIDPKDLASALWGESPPVSWSKADDVRLISLLAYFWNETVDRFERAEKDRAPEFVPHFIDDPWKDDDELRDRATAWCRGFMRVVRTFRNAWLPALKLSRLSLAIESLDEIARTGRTKAFFIKMPARMLPLQIGDAVLSLWRALPAPEDDQSAGSD